MLKLLLFLLSLSIFCSAELEFEEVLDFDPSGLSNAQNATLSLKGDSAFFHVELDTASPYVDYINNFYFSSDNGKTWENVTENFQKILFADYQFLSGQFFHQKLFMFIHKFSEGDDLYIGYFDVKGNLVDKVKIDPEYRYWRIILNHINEDFIGLYSRYFHDPDHFNYLHYFDYSTDRGKTWHNIHPEKLRPSCEIRFELNIRNPEIGFFTFIDYISVLKTDISIFKYNFYDKTYDYSYKKSPYESKDYGFREEDFVLNKYQSNTMPLLDLSKTEIVDTISTYSISNMPQDSIDNLNNDDYEEKLYIYGFFKYLEKDYHDYNFSNFRFNLFKPDTMFCRILHTANRRINGKTETEFYNWLIFSSYDGGETFNFIMIQPLMNIFLNPINNELWILTKNISDKSSRLYKSKTDIFSSVSLEKKYKLNVYFSKNNLIVENDDKQKDCIIKILDLNGRLLLNSDYKLIKGTNQIPLSSQINPNLYLVNIEFKDSKVNIHKIVKGE